MIKFLYGLLAYLLIIFIYAWIYDHFYTGHFHHDRVQFERSVQLHAQNIEIILGDAIENHFKDLNEMIEIKPGCFMNSKSFKYLGAKYDFNKKSYNVGIQFLCKMNSENDNSKYLKNLYFQLKYIFPNRLYDSNELLVHSINSYDEVELHCIFNQGLVEMSLPIPKEKMEKINAFEYAMRGFPDKLGDNFNRMLYFSFVTITSLGYGDVIPLSNSARFVVCTEVILGLIFIGLLVSFFFSIIKTKK